MALGFERAGFDVLAAVELDPVHLAVHERNFPLCAPVCGDVARTSATDLAAAASRGWERRYPGVDPPTELDCIFGGPSCQGFSIIGHRDPHDQRNELVHEFVRLVIEVRPRWFVLENVPGLLSPAYKPVLDKVYKRLRTAGYRVGEPWRLNARDHDTPQERKRVFVVGAREGYELPQPPRASESVVTVGEALDDLPQLARYRTLLRSDVLPLSPSQRSAMLANQSTYVRRLNRVEIDPTDYSDERRWDPSALTSVGLTLHTEDVAHRFRRVKPGVRDDVARLPRLDPEGQSPTLRAGTGRDHGSFTSARPIHHRSPRVITVREAARLHGFPDWFRFHRTRWHGFRQVGNAVPPPLAQAVAGAIVRAAKVCPPTPTRALALGHDQLVAMTLSDAGDRYGLSPDMLPEDVRLKTRSEAAA